MCIRDREERVNNMHFQFLIEDMSGGILIKQVMDKLIAMRTDITCDYKTFRGIGGFKKKWVPDTAKTQKLLNDLPIFLRGYDKSLNVPGYEAALIIVLDKMCIRDSSTTSTRRASLIRLST